MAYKRRKYGKRRGFGKYSKRRGGRTTRGAYRLAKKALKLATADRGYFDQFIAFDDIDEQTGIGQCYDVFYPQIGTSLENRLGSSCKLLKLKIKGYTEMSPGDDDVITYNTIRVTMVLDKACRGVAPNWSDVFVNNGLGVNLTSFRVIQNFERFKVLYDKTFLMTNGGYEQRKFKITKNINKMMSFLANDGDTADKSDWGIFLMFVSDAGGASTSKPQVTWSSRVTFIR